MTADPHAATLGPEARARRDEILHLGLRSLRRRRLRRYAAQATVAIAPALVLAAVVLLSLPGHRGNPSRSYPSAVPTPIALVSDDPTIESRWAVPEGAPATASIDDDALRNLLAQAGLPSGLVRSGDRVLTEFQIARPEPSDAPPRPDAPGVGVP